MPRYNEASPDLSKIILLAICALIFVGGGIGGCAFGCPHYNVWQQEMEGRAEMAKAEQNRQITIAEAQAKESAAKALAGAEIERARGVAEANRIIADSVMSEQYLRYLWIEGLKSDGTQVIYIPTEAGLPILEAGNRGKD